MHLRNNKILKLLAILLFSFELLASTAISAMVREPDVQSEAKTNLSHTQNQNISFLLFLEERSEEEREGKDAFFVVNDLFKFFSSTHSTLAISLTQRSSSNKERFSTHPPLFKLHCTFLI
jgi:hypothetical protein